MPGGIFTVDQYFNPRTSCEVRPLFFKQNAHAIRISIHAPRVRCDGKRQKDLKLNVLFQSTHLV